MTKDELYKMAQTTTHNVLDRNRDLINERILDAFSKDESNHKISVSDAIIKSTALCLSFVPEISAAITANMLVDLGLVTLEDG